jgi:hypothetical protein
MQSWQCNILLAIIVHRGASCDRRKQRKNRAITPEPHYRPWRVRGGNRGMQLAKMAPVYR